MILLKASLLERKRNERKKHRPSKEMMTESFLVIFSPSGNEDMSVKSEIIGQHFIRDILIDWEKS